MNPTANAMRDEARRYRGLATQLETLANELDGNTGKPANGNLRSAPPMPPPRTNPTGVYSGMTQAAAILKALESGPKTTAELFVQLNFGGQKFKERTYVTALLGRLKDKVERNTEGKVQLKSIVMK